MKFLIEAHHPSDIHFWKYPIRILQERGHDVHMIGRDRDVMKSLLEAYDWLSYEIPPRRTDANRFPLAEMMMRHWSVVKSIRRFRPDVVASLMGSYCQLARIMGCRSIIFTDTETQAFNHMIAHPFSHEVHTPDCYRLEFGAKHRRYKGMHELAYLDGRRFCPDVDVLEKYDNLLPQQYVMIRLSAWNTFHDRDRHGIGDQIYEFCERFQDRFRLVVSAEEGKIPPGLEKFHLEIFPKDFHHVLAGSRFILTEGATTASEGACLGVPSVFINSTKPLGYLKFLENEYGLVRNFEEASNGIPAAIEWLESIDGHSLECFADAKRELVESHEDVSEYVVRTLCCG